MVTWYLRNNRRKLRVTRASREHWASGPWASVRVCRKCLLCAAYIHGAWITPRDHNLSNKPPWGYSAGTHLDACAISAISRAIYWEMLAASVMYTCTTNKSISRWCRLIMLFIIKIAPKSLFWKTRVTVFEDTTVPLHHTRQVCACSTSLFIQ
jgi:hypothetical protein